MVSKRKIFQFILIFILGFVLASMIFGFSDFSYEKTDSMDTRYSNGSVLDSAASYDLVMEESAMEEMEMETTADFLMSNITSGEDAGNSSDDAQVLNDTASRKLIKTYHLSFETETFDETKAQLEQLMNLTGAYAESADLSVSSWNHDYHSYYLTIRVPSDKSEAFLNKSAGFGTLTNRTEQVEDVTLDYVDVEARKESLEVEYERVMELLEEAEDLEQILLLESKLSDLRYQLESYESRLRTYDNLIDYTTIYLSIQEVHREQPKTIGERINSGFRESMESLSYLLINLMVFIVSNILLIVLGIIFVWGMIVIIRKTAKKRNKKKIENIDDLPEK